MKIAVVVSGHIPSQWAHSINVMKHANAFKKLGHKVEVLSVQGYYENKFLKQIDSIYEWYGIDKLPIKFFKLPFFIYYKEVPKINVLVRTLNFLTVKNLHNIFDPEKKISEYIKDNNFDLCYARSYRVVKYNILNKTPTIMEIHNPTPHKTKELLEVLKLSNSSYFKGIVTIHEKLKKNFIDLGVAEEKIIVLEDAVDLDMFESVNEDKQTLRDKLKLPQDKKIVMYCGSLKSGKGIHLILKTAKRLEKDENIIFYIVGGNENEIKKYKNWNNEKHPNVIFTGFVKGNLIPYYLKSADVLFMPYDTNEKNTIMDINTTSPIKLFEYMASRVPIITTKIEVIEKILTNLQSAIIVDNDRYDKAILQILSDERLRSDIVNNAYNLVQQYTYKTRCSEILKMYPKVNII